jgi:hypothetical protein
MTERRTSTRHRRLKGAAIVFNGATAVFDCLLRNISQTGACLVLSTPMLVPSRFDLRAEGSNRACVVAWRTSDRVGVRFAAAA